MNLQFSTTTEPAVAPAGGRTAPPADLLERLSRAWAVGPTSDASVAELGRELARFMPCDRALLLAVAPDGSGLQVCDLYEPSPEGLRVGDRVEADGRLQELLHGSLDVAVSADTRLWGDGMELVLAREQVRSCICVVARWKRLPLAVLVVCSRRAHAYRPADVDTLQQIAPALGARLWLARQRRLARASRTPTDEEREWVLMTVVGGLAHHFNNVLAFLLGGLELLPRAGMDDQARSLLERMERRVLEASQTTRALQQFAAEGPPERMERVDLAGLVDEVIELTRPVWGGAVRSAGCAVSVHHERVEGVGAQGNRRDLREAVMNVLFNAIEAMPQGGAVWITEGIEGLWSFIEISDSGVGMPPEVLRRARDPFFTTRPGLRLGLGLSVASGIARRHGGEASIFSEPGKGTIVRLSLLDAGPDAATAR